MAYCRDDFDPDATFSITGKGKTPEDSIKDFEAKRDAKLKELKEKLKCGETRCSPTEGELGADSGKECLFDWAEVEAPEADKKPKEIVRKLHIHRQERKRYEYSRTIEVGCFCIGIADKKDEDK